MLKKNEAEAVGLWRRDGLDRCFKRSFRRDGLDVRGEGCCAVTPGVSGLEDWRSSLGSWSWCVRAHGRQEKELCAGMGAAPCRCAGFRCPRTCRWSFPQRRGVEVGYIR